MKSWIDFPHLFVPRRRRTRFILITTPLDVEIIEGCVPVFKFRTTDVERFPGTPAPFLGGAYFDNKENLVVGELAHPLCGNPHTPQIVFPIGIQGFFVVLEQLTKALDAPDTPNT